MRKAVYKNKKQQAPGPHCSPGKPVQIKKMFRTEKVDYGKKNHFLLFEK